MREYQKLKEFSIKNYDFLTSKEIQLVRKLLANQTISSLTSNQATKIISLDFGSLYKTIPSTIVFLFILYLIKFTISVK